MRNNSNRYNSQDDGNGQSRTQQSHSNTSTNQGDLTGQNAVIAAIVQQLLQLPGNTSTTQRSLEGMNATSAAAGPNALPYGVTISSPTAPSLSPASLATGATVALTRAQVLLEELNHLTGVFNQASSVTSLLNQGTLSEEAELQVMQQHLALTAALEQRRTAVMEELQATFRGVLQQHQSSSQAQASSALPPNAKVTWPLLPSVVQNARTSTIQGPSVPFGQVNALSIPNAASRIPTEAPVRNPDLFNVGPLEYQRDPFPVRLHKILCTAQEKGYDDIIHWSLDGSSFTVENPRRFMTVVAPRYFRTKTFDGFVRQLNLYGFQKLEWGSQLGTYKHDAFQRHIPERASLIRRRVNVDSAT